MQPEVLIGRVTNVQPHPDNEALNNKLDIVTISGKINVANRPSPEQSRYAVGDYAAMLTENLLLPEELLRCLGLWDDEKGKGMLAGKAGNRLKARSMGITTKILSEVMLCPATWTRLPDRVKKTMIMQRGILSFSSTFARMLVRAYLCYVSSGDAYEELSPEGHDVAELLGVQV